MLWETKTDHWLEFKENENILFDWIQQKKSVIKFKKCDFLFTLT